MPVGKCWDLVGVKRSDRDSRFAHQLQSLREHPDNPDWIDWATVKDCWESD